MFHNSTRSYRPRIFTGIQLQHFGTKTCGEHIYRYKKSLEKFLHEKKKKKTRLKYVQKCPQVLLGKNFDWNTISMFLHKNLWIAYLEVQDTIGKIFCKKKKKKHDQKLFNFDSFAQKLVDSIFKGPRHNWKNLLQEKKKHD